MQAQPHSSGLPIAPRMEADTADSVNEALFTTRKMVSKVIAISPALANKLLERAGPGVRHSKSAIEQQAAVMAGHEWLLTHQGLAFGWDGKLLDGYSRLNSVVRAGTTVEMMVTFGLDPACFRAIDTGRARTASNLLQRGGINKHATALAGGLGLYLRYSKALDDNAMPPTTAFTKAELLAACERRPEFAAAVTELMAARAQWRSYVAPSVAATLLFLALDKNHPQELAISFFEKLGTKSWPSEDQERSPIKALFNSLERAKAQADKADLRPEQTLAKCLRAYGAWVQKRGLSNVRGIGWNKADLPGNTADAEAFPTLTRYVAKHHRVPDSQVN